MYRSCPEHPEITVIIQNGEPSANISGAIICNADIRILRDFDVFEVIEISGAQD